MSYKVEVTPDFKKLFKRLLKKYPFLKVELSDLVQSLETNPTQGKALGQDCYKIRIVISSKGKGKSGGGRVITHTVIIQQTVYLLAIYDKSEQDSISDVELRQLIDRL